MLFLYIFLSINGCDNSSAVFKEIKTLNDILNDSTMIETCYSEIKNIVVCLNDSSLIENINVRYSLDEVRFHRRRGNRKSYCISYKMKSSNFRTSYDIYVYVNKPQDIEYFESYEQFIDGLMNREKLDLHWFKCEITDEI